ncbi:MAG: hypothetical protein KatS3mg046_661 [Bellilinea sp.]|nr:MAG: hypothetical protein KatS3mg046_661 [Bellilinea sp.]
MRTYRHLWLYLLIIFMLAWPQPASSSPQAAQSLPLKWSQKSRFLRLGVDEGLLSSTVLSVLQDQQGYLWFTTSNGLSRYDGYSFVNYRHDPENPDSLSSNGLHALIQSRDGLLWIGADPGGLNVYDPKTDRFRSYRYDPQNPNGLPDDSVWALLEDRDGNIWIGTRNGLSRLDRRTDSFTNYLPDEDNPRALAAPVINRLYQDRNATIWVATRAGLQRYDPQTDDFTLFQNNPDDPNSLSHNSVWAMLEDRHGNFWVATRGGGLNLMNRTTGTFRAYKYDPQDEATISDNNLWYLYEDRSGNIWISTENGGLNLFDPLKETFIRFQHDPNNPFSISHNDTYWIVEDRSGALWVTSRYGGVNQLSPVFQRFGIMRHTPGNRAGLSSSDVYSLLAAADGSLWVGTFGGGLNHYDPQTGRMRVYRNDPADPTSLSSNKIYNMLIDRNGTLWIGTSGGGLNRLNPGSRQFVAYKRNLDDPAAFRTNFIFSLAEAPDGRLWVGTLGFGLDLFDPASGTVVERYVHDAKDPHSLSEDTIYDLEVNSRGQVWIATARGGVNLFDPSTRRFTVFTNLKDDPASLASNTVNALYLDEKANRLWAATASGLSRLDLTTQIWKNYTLKDGLPSDTVMSILPDGGGNLWLGTAAGLSRFNPADETFRNYDVQDGLHGNQFTFGAARNPKTGMLYFGGPTGLTYFDPADLKDNSYLPNVLLTGLDLFNQPVRPTDELLPQSLPFLSKLSLPYHQNSITVHFTSLNYQISSKNRYQYMLQGFDKDWSPPRTNREAAYTNLPPGKYTLLVRCTNNDGVWGEITQLPIEIIPPWWQTLPFQIGMALLIVGIVAGGVHLRLSQIRAANRKLEQRVAERTAELETEIFLRKQIEKRLQEQLNQISALQNELRHQAMHDALTGLLNRHQMDSLLTTELSRAKRGGYSICFLLLDLDHFKEINDTYGHLAGDQVLIYVAQQINSLIRQSDPCFRYGGEEFLIVLPNLSLPEGLSRADQIRQAIENKPFLYEGNFIHLSASLGLAVYPLHGENMDALLRGLDEALYRAKRSGRNRIEITGSNISTGS